MRPAELESDMQVWPNLPHDAGKQYECNTMQWVLAKETDTATNHYVRPGQVTGYQTQAQSHSAEHKRRNKEEQRQPAGMQHGVCITVHDCCCLVCTRRACDL